MEMRNKYKFYLEEGHDFMTYFTEKFPADTMFVDGLIGVLPEGYFEVNKLIGVAVLI